MVNEGMIELYQPRHTLIGRDGITMIPHFLRRLSAKKVLVITDKGLVKIGTTGKVTAVLDDAGIEYLIFDEVQPNPTTKIVYQALDFYTKNDCGRRRFSHRCCEGGQYSFGKRRKDRRLQRHQQIQKARCASHCGQYHGRHRLGMYPCVCCNR